MDNEKREGFIKRNITLVPILFIYLVLFTVDYALRH